MGLANIPKVCTWLSILCFALAIPACGIDRAFSDKPLATVESKQEDNGYIANVEVETFGKAYTALFSCGMGFWILANVSKWMIDESDV